MHYQHSLPCRSWITCIAQDLYVLQILSFFLVTYGRESASIRYWLSPPKDTCHFVRCALRSIRGKRAQIGWGKENWIFKSTTPRGTVTKCHFTLAPLMGKINTSSPYWDALPTLSVFTPLRGWLVWTDDFLWVKHASSPKPVHFSFSYNKISVIEDITSWQMGLAKGFSTQHKIWQEGSKPLWNAYTTGSCCHIIWGLDTIKTQFALWVKHTCRDK